MPLPRKPAAVNIVPPAHYPVPKNPEAREWVTMVVRHAARHCRRDPLSLAPVVRTPVFDDAPPAGPDRPDDPWLIGYLDSPVILAPRDAADTFGPGLAALGAWTGRPAPRGTAWWDTWHRLNDHVVRHGHLPARCGRELSMLRASARPDWERTWVAANTLWLWGTDYHESSARFFDDVDLLLAAGRMPDCDGGELDAAYRRLQTARRATASPRRRAALDSLPAQIDGWRWKRSGALD